MCLNTNMHVMTRVEPCKAVSGLQVAKTNRALENEVRGSPDGVGVSSGVHDQLLADPAMCEQFVGLLCQFEPAAVLPFLQSHDSYRYSVVAPYKCKTYTSCMQQEAAVYQWLIQYI